MKNKFLVKLIALVVLCNFAVPINTLSAASENSKAFNRNVLTKTAETQKSDSRVSFEQYINGNLLEIPSLENRIPDSFFIEKEGMKDRGGMLARGWQHLTKIYPNNTNGYYYDYFGRSVSISKNVAIVGAPMDISPGSQHGMVYIYRWNPDNNQWVEEQPIEAPHSGGKFGYSVAISGDTAVIGAPWYNFNNTHSGLAYIFEKNSDTQAWELKQQISAGNSTENAQFGSSIAISGDTIVVGSPLWGNSSSRGAVHFFDKNTDGWWVENPMFYTGSNYDMFGSSVSISGNTAIVGAPRVDANGTYDSGAVYFIKKNEDGLWQLDPDPISINGGVAGAYFGYSVSIAMTEDSAIVGAPFASEDGNVSGLAYILTKDSNENWDVEEELLPEDSDVVTQFGSSVSISDKTAIVGSPYYSDDPHWYPGDDTSSAYIFTKDSDGGWNATKKFRHDGGPEELDCFGWSVAVSGNAVIVGSPLDDDKGDDAGAAYILGDPSMVVVSGTILNYYTQEPIPTAKLTAEVNGKTQIINVPSGNYLFTVPAGSNVSLIPSAPGYIFPSWAGQDNPSWSGIASENIDKDFLGVDSSANITVSGTIKDQAGNAIPVAKLTKIVNNVTEVIDVPNIYYSFSVHPGDTVSLIPSADGYDFPAGLEDNPSWSGTVIDNTAKNFVGVSNAVPAEITGTVLDYYTNQPIPNAKVKFTINGVFGQTDASDGTYSIEGAYIGDEVAILPFAMDYSFPSWAGYDNPYWSGIVASNVVKNFKGVSTNASITVSGTIKDKNGNAIPTAQLTKTVNAVTEVINVPNINYSFSVSPGDQVKITPSAPGFVFPDWVENCDNPEWEGQVYNPVVKHFIGGYTIIVKTDGTLGALVKKTTNAPEQGVLLAYFVAPNDSFLESFVPITPVNYTFTEWETIGKKDGKGEELLTLNIPKVTNNRVAIAHFEGGSANTR